MNKPLFIRLQNPAFAAYGVALLFLLRFPTYLLPQTGEIVVILAVAPHLLLFPVVTALPAPRWAQAAGYGWLVIDITTDIMGLNGVPATIFLPMRYGGHVSAALWIIVASWRTTGAIRIVGILLALFLGSYSFVAPLPGIPMFVGLLPVLILLPLWFILVGRLLQGESKVQAAES